MVYKELQKYIQKISISVALKDPQKLFEYEYEDLYFDTLLFLEFFQNLADNRHVSTCSFCGNFYVKNAAANFPQKRTPHHRILNRLPKQPYGSTRVWRQPNGSKKHFASNRVSISIIQQNPTFLPETTQRKVKPAPLCGTLFPMPRKTPSTSLTKSSERGVWGLYWERWIRTFAVESP